MINKHSWRLRFGICLLLVSLFFGISAQGAWAVEVPKPGFNFGGKLLFSYPCSCGVLPFPSFIPGSILLIGLPKPAVVAFQFPISTLYKWFNIVTPGVWTLGNGVKTPMSCYQYNPVPPFTPPCIPDPVGTSVANANVLKNILPKGLDKATPIGQGTILKIGTGLKPSLF